MTRRQKRKVRKLLLTLSCAVMLVAVSVGATLAYLTDEHSVTNTFTVGKVGISLDEVETDEYGVANEDELRIPREGSDKTGNTYKLVPGHTYVKDPIIHVDNDSENSWVFVKIENELAAIETAAAEENGTKNSIHAQLVAAGWSVIDETNNIYAYKDIVAKETDVDTFKNFTIDGDKLGNDNMSTYVGKNIKVTAYAVQADTFSTAADAWNATFGKTTTPVEPPVEP